MEQAITQTVQDKWQEELYKEYTDELDKKKATMIELISKMGADELELMWKKFNEFEMDLFLEGIIHE